MKSNLDISTSQGLFNLLLPYLAPVFCRVDRTLGYGHNILTSLLFLIEQRSN